MDLRAVLEPPLHTIGLLDAVSELSLARELEGSPYHHLDTLDHVIEVVRGVERELEESRVNARLREDRVHALRLAALLHDVAKPVTRGELEGRVLFVSHDSLGARMVRHIGQRLGLSAGETDLTATLTALHLKIGFMGHPRTDYPPERLARAAGPFGEELAVLSWADRRPGPAPQARAPAAPRGTLHLVPPCQPRTRPIPRPWVRRTGGSTLLLVWRRCRVRGQLSQASRGPRDGREERAQATSTSPLISTPRCRRPWRRSCRIAQRV